MLEKAQFLFFLKLTTKAGHIYTNKMAKLLKMVNMLINVNCKIIKNNQIKNSCCQEKSHLNFLNLKANLRTNFNPFIMTNFCWFYGERTLYNVLWRFHQFSRSYEVIKFWIWRKWRHNTNVQNFLPLSFLLVFVFSTKCYILYDHFPRTEEVAKFWMIKLNLFTHK